MIVQINKQGDVVNTFNNIDEVKQVEVSRNHFNHIKAVVDKVPGRYTANGHFWVKVTDNRTTPVSIIKNGRVARVFGRIAEAVDVVGKRAECISMHVRGQAYPEEINGFTVKQIAI